MLLMLTLDLYFLMKNWNLNAKIQTQNLFLLNLTHLDYFFIE